MVTLLSSKSMMLLFKPTKVTLREAEVSILLLLMELPIKLSSLTPTMSGAIKVLQQL